MERNRAQKKLQVAGRGHGGQTSRGPARSKRVSKLRVGVKNERRPCGGARLRPGAGERSTGKGRKTAVRNQAGAQAASLGENKTHGKMSGRTLDVLGGA